MTQPQPRDLPHKFNPSTYHPEDEALPSDWVAVRIATDISNAAHVAALARYWRKRGKKPVDYRRRA